MRIHTGDFVLVIAGKDKGKTGTVLRVLGDRLVVSDANMRTRHVRKTTQGPGQRLKYEASIAASNVMVMDAKTKKPTRIGVKIDEKGRKTRIAKVSGEVLVAGKVKPKKGPKAAPLKGQESEKGKESKEGGAEVQKVAGPDRKPFWKRLSFGAEAVQEGEEPKGQVSDKSVPAETRIPESFSHGRGA
ncbi:MAG: 50S ribosomal protein L24 [Candidatus Peribacteraceae bacterium]|nr:50S ribosomal protein L24 [Candidatus Peribacteraceae bacterium]MDD5742054.1 50S ribosomal protein L24 [Candidatus Peribacteraceae bacterium]